MNKRHFPAIYPVSKSTLTGVGVLLTFSIMFAIGLWPLPHQAADPTGAIQDNVLQPDACVVETLTYTRCNHTLVRRLPLPQELIGCAKEQAQAYFEDSRITAFSPSQVEITMPVDLFCAAHAVLQPDEAGVLAVFENKYGDGMAFIRSLGINLSTLPESVREQVRLGMGFDTQEQLEQWLENMES